jgi:hypothetical protein
MNVFMKIRSLYFPLQFLQQMEVLSFIPLKWGKEFKNITKY